MGPASFLTLSAERAVYSVWALVSVGAGILLYSLIKGDFRMAYVWATSKSHHADAYKVAAWWGGQEARCSYGPGCCRPTQPFIVFQIAASSAT